MIGIGRIPLEGGLIGSYERSAETDFPSRQRARGIATSLYRLRSYHLDHRRRGGNTSWSGPSWCDQSWCDESCRPGAPLGSPRLRQLWQKPTYSTYLFSAWGTSSKRTTRHSAIAMERRESNYSTIRDGIRETSITVAVVPRHVEVYQLLGEELDAIAGGTHSMHLTLFGISIGALVTLTITLGTG